MYELAATIYIAFRAVSNPLEGCFSRECLPSSNCEYIEHIHSIGSRTFSMLYRIFTEIFYDIPELIHPHLFNAQEYRDMFCGRPPLCTRLELLVKIRLLSGASYLDNS